MSKMPELKSEPFSFSVCLCSCLGTTTCIASYKRNHFTICLLDTVKVVFVCIFIATKKTGKIVELACSSRPSVCSVLPLGPPALPVWQGEPPH